jgi:hypothetical protein
MIPEATVKSGDLRGSDVVAVKKLVVGWHPRFAFGRLTGNLDLLGGPSEIALAQ